MLGRRDSQRRTRCASCRRVSVSSIWLTKTTSWPQFIRCPKDIKSIRTSSSGSGLAPRLAWAERLKSALLNEDEKRVSSASRAQMEMAASKAWPEEDCEGGNKTVLVSERLLSNSRTRGREDAPKSRSAVPRLS